ncbi:MAG TPA: hypothetical protein VG320_05275 [Paraburkholderia sp.]|jgi:hypothetical protein|uniref:glycosyltransferase family 9 protein n=1 Tax=Paraburkholderia sp. TaxID=1926495 RepID=UPI002DF0CA7D|nr:hypothetical protein [Paraburkholderia sp.]
MSDFRTSVRMFHQHCNEKRVEAARDLVERLGQAAVSEADHIMLGYCQSRLGMFEQAERTLSAVWPSLTPREAQTVNVARELATVKLHLRKIDEGSAIDKLLHSRSWYTLPDPEAAAFIPLVKERLLEEGDAVEGKRVFVMFAGGQGDNIEQFRHFDNLLAEGASVVCANPPASLCELFANAPVALTQLRGTYAAIAECDAIALGHMLNWRYWRDGAPAAARADYLRQVRPRERPIEVAPQPGKRKIGIVWRSDNTTWEQCRHEPFRSMALSTLEPLLADTGSRFFSLQFGSLTQSEQAILARHDVVDAAPLVHSFADLAEIVAQLDLVVTIDSAGAHLCGALDVPVWNLLAQVSDWRWGDAAQRSTPFYRSMRLFRQKTLGDWEPVIAEVCAELARVSPGSF